MEIAEIVPIDGERAWLRANGAEHSWLFLTIDGGKTWKRANPDRLPFTTVATLPRAIASLVGAPDGSLYASGQGRTRHRWISRINPLTGSVSATIALPGTGLFNADVLAVFAGAVWYAGQDPHDTHASTLLYRLDADTLQISEQIAMDAPPAAVVAVPNGVWVGAGRSITLFDARGDPVQHESIGGRVTHLAVDPSGTLLYVATDTQLGQSIHVVFQERLASTGTLLGSGRHMGYMDLDGPTSVVPIVGGVWVTNPTGMMALARLYRADDLTPVGGPDPDSAGSYTGVNSMSNTLAANVLWIFDLAVALTCADPETGHVIERIGPYPSQAAISDVTEVDGTILANWRSIQRLDPSSRCLSSSA